MLLLLLLLLAIVSFLVWLARIESACMHHEFTKQLHKQYSHISK
jgi:hypothetical protein